MADDAGHVEELVGLYHLGELGPASAARVREHLETCGRCRDEAAAVCDLLGALALLTEERQTLANAYGALGTAVPPAFPERFAPVEEPEDEPGPRRRVPWPHRPRRTDPAPAAGPAPVAAQPAAPPPAAPPPAAEPPPSAPPAPAPRVVAAPASPGPSAASTEQASLIPARTFPRTRPAPSAARVPRPTPAPPAAASSAREPAPAARTTVDAPATAGDPSSRQRRRALLASTTMLAATVALAGVAVTALLRDGSDDAEAPGVPVVVSAAASTTDVDSRATMTVALTENGESVHVRVELTGLAKKAGYRLYGYGLAGNRWPVVNWTSRTGKKQSLSGTVPARIADISHFAVVRSNRSVVVTVYIQHGEAAVIGPNGS
ncbi:zf-HC2 domain-containing protein [Actinoplanes sp. RD1]|uniref:zf-HC2 domain-containing protein n=1 Tax=Actinoplanes sp. RD1 TaxID=3064538 RepID=UPI00274187F4|nr:zf-HC2 domain-containing protein [Actinoplanes sp. RD1]